MSLVVTPQFRRLRAAADLRILAMADLTGVAAPVLSQLERGERVPRQGDMEGLERGYGPREGWYAVRLEEV